MSVYEGEIKYMVKLLTKKTDDCDKLETSNTKVNKEIKYLVDLMKVQHSNANASDAKTEKSSKEMTYLVKLMGVLAKEKEDLQAKVK